MRVNGERVLEKRRSLEKTAGHRRRWGPLLCPLDQEWLAQVWSSDECVRRLHGRVGARPSRQWIFHQSLQADDL